MQSEVYCQPCPRRGVFSGGEFVVHRAPGHGVSSGGEFVASHAPGMAGNKLVEPSGFEPLTSSLPAKRSTN